MPTVAACQCEVDDLDPEANFERLEHRIAGLPDATDLAVFPEHYLTGFVADERIRTAARSRATVVERLEPVASEHDVAVLTGYVERGVEREGDENGNGNDDGGAKPPLHNATTYVGPEGQTATYRKRHLWDRETEWLTAGEGRVVVDTPLGRTGLLTCYDLNFVAESAAFTEDRVDALLVAGAWPAPHGDNWRLLCRARALDGVRWVVAAGRCGRSSVGERETVYAGRSLVVRPNGTVHSALDVAPGDLVADVDPTELARHRETVAIFDD